MWFDLIWQTSHSTHGAACCRWWVTWLGTYTLFALPSCHHPQNRQKCYHCMTLHENMTSSTKQELHHYYYCYNCFSTLCPGLSGWVGTRRINHSGFCWSRHDGVAVASAEPYASYLHFAPENNHASTSSVRFLRAGCSSWHPTNIVKALKAIIINNSDKQ